MASSSELWSHGLRKWWISHEGINGPKGLEFSGELPNDFQLARSEMEAAQKEAGGDKADVDYIFEIPLQVAKSITGFKHDEVSAHIVGNKFRIMRREVQQGGLFSRLFGKK